MKKHVIFIVLLIIASVAMVSSKLAHKSEFLAKLKAQLALYHQEYPQEKVYLQFDKTFYKPGEDIWFNAFVLGSNDHKPTKVSDVLHVELVDPKGAVIKRLDLYVKAGTARGDFHLDSSRVGGLYKVRAYTRWMKNFQDLQFQKDLQVQKVITPKLLMTLDFDLEAYGPGDSVSAELQVRDLRDEPASAAKVAFNIAIDGAIRSTFSAEVDANGLAQLVGVLPDDLATTDGILQARVTHQGLSESIAQSIPIVLNNIQLSLFPEGGQMIVGVNSKIAFKAVNEHNKGADISAVVVDENDSIITSFHSRHMGMGYFYLTPTKDKAYRVKVTRPEGIAETYPLPSALNNGYNIQAVSNQQSELSLAVHSPNTETISVVATLKGEIYYAGEHVANASKSQFTIPTREWPRGIAVVTLFDSMGIAQAERLVFINSEKGLNIDLKTNRQSYKPGSPVKLQIHTSNHKGEPTSAKVSLAVVDDRLLAFADDKQDNILSHLLISSELNGKIEEPSYYFDPEEDDRQEALDLLMLTHGWRRFSWEEIASPNVQISYQPDRNDMLTGNIANTKRSTEVYLVELDQRKRIVKGKTDESGNFSFLNTDPRAQTVIITKKPGTLRLEKSAGRKVIKNAWRSQYGNGQTRFWEIRGSASQRETELRPIETVENNELDLNMTDDVTELSEVVTLGYASVERRNLAGSISIIDVDDQLLWLRSINQALAGRVTGVSIANASGTNQRVVPISIRGSSTLASANQPLIVVDEVPIGNYHPNGLASLPYFGPEEISSISVLKSAEAAAMYGTAGANGVIVITSKLSPVRYRNRTSNSSKYSSLLVQPRVFARTREFPTFDNTINSTRADNEITTIYWNPSIQTDEKGKAEVTFRNTNKISTFRMVAEGFDRDGLLGRGEETFTTIQPVVVDVKMPESISFEDSVILPITIRNNTTNILSGELRINSEDGVVVLDSGKKQIDIKPNHTENIWLQITSDQKTGNFPIGLVFQSDNHTVEINRLLSVYPVGFPRRVSFSSRELVANTSVNIIAPESGTIRGTFQAYPNLLRDLACGMESIFKEPHGCFEQVSSFTFPNILALQYLKTTGEIDAKTTDRALQLIEKGYKKLTSYEIQGGGFDWFGNPPAHEGLTAFGLFEFTEMKKVYPGVSQAMLDRTKKWLLSRRDGNGGFYQRSRYRNKALSEKHINTINAYIVFALSEAGVSNIGPEYQRALEVAIKSRDAYQMALLANAALNRSAINDYEKLTAAFTQSHGNTSYNELTAHQSMVGSYGKSLNIEILSLWSLAWMKSNTKSFRDITEVIDYILTKRSFGRFGSTQATTMALKALATYASFVQGSSKGGRIQIALNGQTMDEVDYLARQKELIELNKFNTGLIAGINDFKIEYSNTSNPLPYSLDLEWYTKIPKSDSAAKVRLTTRLNTTQVEMHDFVRLEASASNITQDDLPMTMMTIGIPAGLSLQSWQLKEQLEEKVFDFYEINENKLIIYYTHLAPSEVKSIKLDLKAEIPGKYIGSASSAYLYYFDEVKDWNPGLSVEVNR